MTLIGTRRAATALSGTRSKIVPFTVVDGEQTGTDTPYQYSPIAKWLGDHGLHSPVCGAIDVVAGILRRPDGYGRCHLGPASAVGCHRIRFQGAAHWPCLIVIGWQDLPWGGTRWRACLVWLRSVIGGGEYLCALR